MNAFISNTQTSDDNTMYRAKTYNYCRYQSGSGSGEGYEYGKIFTIRIKDQKSQYWIKDSPLNDIGDEPNTPDLTNYTHSFDVWVRQRSNYETRVWGYMDQKWVESR